MDRLGTMAFQTLLENAMDCLGLVAYSFFCCYWCRSWLSVLKHKRSVQVFLAVWRWTATWFYVVFSDDAYIAFPTKTLGIPTNDATESMGGCNRKDT